MLVLHGAGAALAPLFVGIMMNVVGIQGMPAYMAVILSVLALYAVYQVRHVSVLTSGEQVHFEPMVQTSHEIVEMIEKEGDDAEPDSVHLPSDEPRRVAVKTG